MHVLVVYPETHCMLPMPAKHALLPDSLFLLCAHVRMTPSPAPYVVGADQEASLVVQALRPNTLYKFTFADCKQFNSIVADIFVGVAFEDVVAKPDLEQVHYVTTTYVCSTCSSIYGSTVYICTYLHC